MSPLVSRLVTIGTLTILSLSLITAGQSATQAFSGYATHNDVMLHWTAPGDNGNQGRASYYDVRLATEPISENNWDEAFQIDNEPIPGIAGSPESMAIGGLGRGLTYYFCIRTADERFNWSGLSNNAVVTTSASRVLSVAKLKLIPPDRSRKKSYTDVFVWVVDQDDQVVAGATVEVLWKGPRTVKASWTTNSKGVANFTSPQIAAARAFWCLSVTNISHEADSYQPGNIEQVSVCDSTLGTKEAGLPEFELTQNFPNPFNPETEIGFSLLEASPTSLKVYNVLGQEISVLVEQFLPAGNYSFAWRADGLPSGVYYYRLIAGSFTQTRKMILLK